MTFIVVHSPFFSRILCLKMLDKLVAAAKTAERIHETATLTRPTGLLNSDFRRSDLHLRRASSAAGEFVVDGLASGRRFWSFGVKFVVICHLASHRLCEMESLDSSANTWRRLRNNKTRHAGRRAVEESWLLSVPAIKRETQIARSKAISNGQLSFYSTFFSFHSLAQHFHFLDCATFLLQLIDPRVI